MDIVNHPATILAELYSQSGSMDVSAETSEMEAAHAAVKFMLDNTIPPTSENFAVWSTYVAGANRTLCDEVNTQIANGRRIDAALCAELHNRFFSYKRTADQVLRADQDTRRSLEAIATRLGAAAEDRRTYSGALNEGGAALAAARDRHEVKNVIEVLTFANEVIGRRSSGLEKDLSDTVSRLKQIKDDIAAFQIETLTDGLTGLANRKLLDKALHQAVRRASKLSRPLAFVMCDIDHFKALNDTWGHPVGDQVIRFVASVLKAEAADHYTVARYGGEEFAVVMPDTGVAEAGSYAEIVRDRIARKRLTRRASKQDIGHVTISLGVATLEPDEQGQALMQRADDNLYVSKERGRNRVTFEKAS